MRTLIGCFAVVAVMVLGNATAPLAMAAAHGDYAMSAAQQQPPAQGKLDVKIDVGKQNSGGGIWWQSPIWLAIGGIALVLLILIVAMIARGGGGTTVVRG
jgi:hypothetical protein